MQLNSTQFDKKQRRIRYNNYKRLEASVIYHSIFECEYGCNVERLVREFMVCKKV